MRRVVSLLALAAAAAFLPASSCSTGQIVGGTAAGVVGTTWYAGRSPAHEIEQVYYLGVFDPQEQVPPTVYRITVRGQASALSNVKFSSGWVHSSVVDSLGTSISHDEQTGKISIDRGSADELATLQTGRRMVLFGPEGFREAPRDHRLVVVMGASPDTFFNAVDRVLGAVGTALDESKYDEIRSKVLRSWIELQGERDRLRDLERSVDSDLKG